MRHFSSIALVVALVLIGILVTSHRAADAQDATPAALMGHPVVGVWLADTEPEVAGSGSAVFAFQADGTYLQVEEDGVSIGTWAATGERTADLTIVSVEGGGDAGMIIVRARIEVAADNQSFTAAYTIEVVGPDGTATGQYGPGTATGTRIAVEPIGTPIGSLDDLFAQFEEQATPEASPTT